MLSYNLARHAMRGLGYHATGPSERDPKPQHFHVLTEHSTTGTGTKAACQEAARLWTKAAPQCSQAIAPRCSQTLAPGEDLREPIRAPTTGRQNRPNLVTMAIRAQP